MLSSKSLYDLDYIHTRKNPTSLKKRKKSEDDADISSGSGWRSKVTDVEAVLGWEGISRRKQGIFRGTETNVVCACESPDRQPQHSCVVGVAYAAFRRRSPLLHGFLFVDIATGIV